MSITVARRGLTVSNPEVAPQLQRIFFGVLPQLSKVKVVARRVRVICGLGSSTRVLGFTAALRNDGLKVVTKKILISRYDPDLDSPRAMAVPQTPVKFVKLPFLVDKLSDGSNFGCSAQYIGIYEIIQVSFPVVGLFHLVDIAAF